MEITDKQVEDLYLKLLKDAQAGGYNLNSDTNFVKELLKGLLTNEQRYGYISCPCRLASGKQEEDLDIICPCDYRDGDVDKYGACYCALYVSKEVLDGKKKLGSIPESRPVKSKRMEKQNKPQNVNISSLSLPVYRCKVCGYLCARENPPEICPICKAKKDRFEKFI